MADAAATLEEGMRLLPASSPPGNGGHHRTMTSYSSYQHHHDHHHIAHSNSTDHLHELLHHLHDYHLTSSRRFQLLLYMGLTLLYFAIVSSLLAANNLCQDDIEARYFLPFHYTEFWSSFAFILIGDDHDILTFDTPMGLGVLYLLSFNVVTSLMAALLFSLHPATYEVPSHLIEYSSQITITLVDFVFIWQGNGRRGGSNSSLWQRAAAVAPETTNDAGVMPSSSFVSRNAGQVLFVTLLLMMDIFKFLFYVELIPCRIGAERSSHYFEFVGEMLNSLWAFFYAKQLFVKLSKDQINDLRHVQEC